MGHYFILDRDAAFAIAIQDALEEAGHSAEVFQDPLKALAALVDFGADVLVLDLGATELDERSLIGTFHNVPETRSLPIVGLTERTESKYIVGVLQLGVTDVLSRKWPIEELVARLTRTSGQETSELPMMQGRLAGRQLIDFLEYLRHLGKSGLLRVTSSGGAGRIDIYRGGISSARFKNLRGRSAALAMLDQNSGRFRLEAAESDLEDERNAHSPQTIDLQSVLLRAAWLSDKLVEYREWVPRSGHELELVSAPSEDALGELTDSIPFAPVIELAASQPSIRLHDLQQKIDSPPQELRLVLAVLSQLGHLQLRSIESPPSTQELKSNLGVEYSVLGLLDRARQSGVKSRLVTLLLLAEPDAWPRLCAMFDRLREPPFDQLSGQLETQDRGSVVINTEAGRLALHLHQLDPRMPGNVKTVISVCDGLLLWVADASDTDLLSDLVQRVRNNRQAIRGFMIAEGEAAQAWSHEALASRPDWTISSRPPTRLSSLLRCFFSRATEQTVNRASGSIG